MAPRRRRDHYSPPGVVFHWLMAALFVFQLWWGWRTGGLVAGYDKLRAYEIHMWVGLVILGLALLRLAWRLYMPAPASVDVEGLEETASSIAYRLFYVLMLGLPLSGLVILYRPEWEDWAERAHVLMVWGLVGLTAVHAAAALRHHFWNRDRVLTRMIPGLKPLGKPRPERGKERPGRGRTARAGPAS